jgi:hypothetical protein
MKNEQTRQPYVAGALVKLGRKVIEEVKKHGKDIITEPTAGQKKIEPLTKKQRAYRKGTRNAAVGGAGIYAGAESLLSEPEKEEEVYEDTPINYTVDDLPQEGAMIIEKNEKDVTYINKDFEEAAKSAKGSTFTYDDTEYETKAVLEALKRLKKAEGGAVEEDEDMNANNFRMMRKSFLEEYTRAETPEKKQALQKNFTRQTEGFDHDTKLKVFQEEQKQRNKKAEGGSLMVPPEMEMEQEVPEDTYPNIPEDEMEEAVESQKPDGEMQEDYMGSVIAESLDTTEQEYLMKVLEGDEQLSAIIDKVFLTASEFSGAGEVEGPGTGVSDSIPARLSDGEFVMTKKATDQIGADELQTMMDEAEKAYDGGLMTRKASGGLLSKPDDLQDDEIKKTMIGANRMPSVKTY